MTRLVPTGDAVRELRISYRTLQVWVAQGLITLTFTTAVGHARRDLDDLHRQITCLRERADGDTRPQTTP